MDIALKKQAQNERAGRLALDIMHYIQDHLVTHMPYLSRTVLCMPVVFAKAHEGSETIQEMCGHADAPGTDGERIYIDPEGVIRRFETDEKALSRVIMHMLLHCLYAHPYHYGQLQQVYWDFAADVAVEAVILEMGQEALTVESDDLRRRLLEEIRGVCGELTAERIYHVCLTDKKARKELIVYAEFFQQDMHIYWLGDESRQEEEIRRHWQRIRKDLKVRLETRESAAGDTPGTLKEKLAGIQAGPEDYSTFLRRFAVPSEEMQLSRDAFDTIFYTYGLELYGDIPLIEPLETREALKIRDLVIAIDTSASTQGETVREFLRQTYTILKQTESFFDHTDVHIIQCDCAVTADDRLTCAEDFKKYVEETEIVGVGGTDFRPVFDHVRHLQEAGEMTALQGLLYFTDGEGTFPEADPGYRTAFVFPAGGSAVKVPDWAMSVCLQEKDIRQERID